MSRRVAYGCSGAFAVSGVLYAGDQGVTGCSGSLSGFLFNPNSLNPDPNYDLNNNGNWNRTEPRQCQACGALGQVYKCEYCGTRL